MGPDRASLQLQRLRNFTQTILLVLGMTALLALAAGYLAGPTGVAWTLAAIAATAALSPALPSRWLLGSLRARPLPRMAAPQVHHDLDRLAARAGLPHAPALLWVPTAALTAFAVGNRDRGAIAVSEGLLRSLDRRELRAVLAHEIAHIRAGDVRIMTVSDAVAQLTHHLATAGTLLTILAVPLLAVSWQPMLAAVGLTATPTVMTILQRALSRSREHDADLAAVDLTGDPMALAAALATLERQAGPDWERRRHHPRRQGVSRLLSTHPPTHERIRRVTALTTPPASARPLARRGYAGDVVSAPRMSTGTPGASTVTSTSTSVPVTVSRTPSWSSMATSRTSPPTGTPVSWSRRNTGGHSSAAVADHAWGRQAAG